EQQASAKKEIALPSKEKETPREKFIQQALDQWEAESEAHILPVIPAKVPSPVEVISPELETIPAVIPPKRVGQIRLYINDQEVGLEEPILIRERIVFVPLRDIAKGLNFSVLNLDEAKFRLIFPGGESQEVVATFIERIPMVSQDKINEYFSVESNYDAAKGALFVSTKYLPKFKTYLVKTEQRKPEELLEDEEPLLRKARPAGPPKFIPEAARPSIDLKGSNAYMFRDYHFQSTYHSESCSIWGKFYDYDLRYETYWKDMPGEFGHDYTYLNLYKDDFWIDLFDRSVDLNPLKNQSQGFTGLRVAKAWTSRNKTTIFGGDIDDYFAESGGETAKYLGQIFGVEQEYMPWYWLGLKGAILYLENKEIQPGSLSGRTAFPRRNLIYFMDNTLRLPHNLSLFGQLAQCNYHPDNQPDQSMDDWDWRAGSEWFYPRGRMKFAYEFIGDEYISLGNPLIYQDYKGWELYNDYRVTDRWRVAGNLRRYEDNVDQDPDKITTQNQALSLYSSHQIFDHQSVTLSFSRFNSKPSGPDAGMSSQADLYRIDYFLPFISKTNLLLNYQYSTFNTDGGGSYYSHSPGLSLFKSFGRGSSWYFRQDFIKSLYREEENALDSTSTFNLNYVFTPRFRTDFNSTYTRNMTKSAKTAENLTGSFNLKYQLTPKTNLNFEYAVHSYDLNHTADKWPENWSVMLYIRQDFDIRSPLNFGRLKGRVVLDVNANGKFDPGEPGIEGASLKLEDGRKARTDQEGYFSFDYVCPGMQKVHLDIADLPLEWTSRELEKEIKVRQRRQARLNFLLIKSASIRGKVFIDTNEDLLFQGDEEPLENIAVLLLPQEQFRYTDHDGNFRFDYLLPGRYKIKIYSEDFPIGCRPISPSEREVELSPGQEIKDLDFSLQWETPIKKF
nr:hypothetical protein [Candidatus Aminicenantes bacterium]